MLDNEHLVAESHTTGDQRSETVAWDDPRTSVGLEAAIAKVNAELPGWWWRVGCCQVSADATVAPALGGPDDDLLAIPEFDHGFDNDLRHPATMAEALLGALEKAKGARALALLMDWHLPAPGTEPGSPAVNETSNVRELSNENS